MKPIIVGQAPARTGSGLAFEGASGRRLCKLMGVETRDELKEYFHLTNLIRYQLDRHPRGKGDTFDRHVAKQRAQHMMESALPGQIFIACGRQVWHAMTGSPTGPFYSWRDLRVHTKRQGNYTVKVYLFPHPSGTSHVWNYPIEMRVAESFLRNAAEGRWPHSSVEPASSS